MKKKLLLMCGFALLATSAFCQDLSVGDSLEIKRQARFCIIQFGDILNQLAKPDEYFRKYNVENFIRKFYEDASRDQIFRDSLVLIEDDLNPNSRPPTFEEEKPIQRYLNDFFQFYEKSIGTSVVFSDIQVSDVQQGEYLYVNVTYENEFLNKHKYIDQSYEKYKRVATVKAEPANTGWKVLITYVGFFRTPTLERNEAISFDEKVNQLPKEVTPEKEEILEEKPIGEQQTVANVQKGNFSNVQEIYKRGESFKITWDQGFENPVNLSLYQEKTHKLSLNPGITNNQYTGAIPKKTKPGEKYNFQLYDPVTKTSVQSGYFKVRRRIPLGLQIPVYVGVGAAVFLLLQDKGTGPEPTTTEQQPFPNPPNPTDN